jgi:deoxyribose-phosphate aldolase
VSPEKGRFRTFLLAAVKHFLINEWKRGNTQKRGGGATIVDLDGLDPAVRDACGEATLKVIFETSELETYDNIRAASFLAMRILRPGDFIKTSTGKTSANATLGNNQVMLEAIRDHYLATGVEIAMKPAGGIRTAKQAIQFLIAVKETLGDAWLRPERYRFGASALLNDLVRQLAKEQTGRYQAGYRFSESAGSY